MKGSLQGPGLQKSVIRKAAQERGHVVKSAIIILGAMGFVDGSPRFAMFSESASVHRSSGKQV